MTVCDAIGGLLKLLARDVDADVSWSEDCGDVGRAMESGGGNAIEEGVAMPVRSNLDATPSEMCN